MRRFALTTLVYSLTTAESVLTMALVSVPSVLARRAIVSILFFTAVFGSLLVIFRAAESLRGYPLGFPSRFDYSAVPFIFPKLDGSSLDGEEHNLENVLKGAAMKDKTVILTTLNEAWAAPNSIIDLFLESFRIGIGTRGLLKNLVVIALDQKAFRRCLAVHNHCFALVTEGVDFSREAYFMTVDYLKMMWRRIDFLRSVLEMGYNFVFTDADVMWFRNPFPHFYLDADFQIACDHFFGSSDDLENRVNGGFLYVKSNSRSIDFYKFWYSSQEDFPGSHDQDVLNNIKHDPYISEIGLTMKFLDTAYFGGFCEPSKDLNKVCTMHANCCFGMESKLHDLRIMLENWKQFLSLPHRAKEFSIISWSVPQNCSLSALRLSPQENHADEGKA